MTDTTQNDEEQQAEHAACEQKSLEYLNGWKRATADYANLKREHERSLAELSSMMRATCVSDLAPVLANWKRAAQHIPDADSKKEWVKGLLQIQTQFGEILKRYGVQEIETRGTVFNALLHEAVGSKKEDGKSANEILEEVEPGYMMNGIVIKPAKVIINE